MVEAFITPQLLRWARERSHETASAAAKKVNVKPDVLGAWEQGDARPTLHQARTLAQKLHIPFGYLFLSSPPPLESPLPDLRTVTGQIIDPSPEFYDVLNDALRKQEWYKDYLKSQDGQPLPFIGKYSLSASNDEIAIDIHQTLSIRQTIWPLSDNWEQFLKALIQKSEEIGVLVLRNSVVGNNTHRSLSAEEFRGFVISDEIAPLVFLNGSDARAAQTFTLIHELAHLWIGKSGISNPDYRSRPQEQNHPVERKCDQITAEVLVPAEDFLQIWNRRVTVDENVRHLTRWFKVSRMVILRRAFELDSITEDAYWQFYEEFRATTKNSEPKQGGGDFFRNLFVRNSHMFTTAVIGRLLEGSVSHREASHLLNIQAGTLDQLTKQMTGEPV